MIYSSCWIKFSYFLYKLWIRERARNRSSYHSYIFWSLTSKLVYLAWNASICHDSIDDSKTWHACAHAMMWWCACFQSYTVMSVVPKSNWALHCGCCRQSRVGWLWESATATVPSLTDVTFLLCWLFHSYHGIYTMHNMHREPNHHRREVWKCPAYLRHWKYFSVT